MKVKVSKAEREVLDWMVATCEGHLDDETIIRRLEPDEEGWCIAYSTDWSQSGPIIEREGIALYMYGDSDWNAHVGGRESVGPTPLVAAMRCYVASRFGDEVDVPDDLI